MLDFKEFDRRVKHIAARLNIPFINILKWRYIDIIKAWDLLYS